MDHGQKLFVTQRWSENMEEMKCGKHVENMLFPNLRVFIFTSLQHAQQVSHDEQTT